VSSREAQLRLRIAFHSSATEATAAPFEPPRAGQPDLSYSQTEGRTRHLRLHELGNNDLLAWTSGLESRNNGLEDKAARLAWPDVRPPS